MAASLLDVVFETLPHWTVLTAVGAVAVLGLILLVAFSAVPGAARIEAAAIDEAREGSDHVDADREALLGLGFAPCGPPLRVAIPGNPLVFPFLHRSHDCFAAVYRVDNLRNPRAVDVVTLFDAPDCGLTTTTIHEIGNAPTWLGAFRQVLADAKPEALLQAHLDGVRFLTSRGLRPRQLQPADLLPTIQASFRLQRRVFTRRPVRSVLTTMWRLLSRRHPHLLPLEQQPTAEREARELGQSLA